MFASLQPWINWQVPIDLDLIFGIDRNGAQKYKLVFNSSLILNQLSHNTFINMESLFE